LPVGILADRYKRMSQTLKLTNGMVITATGDPPFRGGVAVDNGIIVDVFHGGAPAGTGATVIDVDGRSLLPGLIDAHVHATAVDVDIQLQASRRFESEVAVLAARSLTEMLERGFTTVRDAGGADAGLRRALEQGAFPGPRLLVSGRPITQTGGHGDQRPAAEWSAGCGCRPGPHVGMVSAIADGPDEVRQAVREELRRGADQIKVMASGGVMSPTDPLTSVQYSLAEISAAVQAAQAVGTYVLAHAYTAEAVRICAEAGVRSIEHGNLIDEETARFMAMRGTFLVPTLVTYERLHTEGPSHGIGPDRLHKLGAVLDAGLESLEMAQRSGVKIGSGSDLLGPMRRYQGDEVALQAQALGAMGAIIACTRTNAELLHLEGEIGTLEPGKRADLVVVDGDVLADPGLIGRADKTALVVQSGNIAISRLATS
jgi:imidazolonepropionase-like amidohydrolase